LPRLGAAAFGAAAPGNHDKLTIVCAQRTGHVFWSSMFPKQFAAIDGHFD
jgi:hypothetical protein